MLPEKNVNNWIYWNWKFCELYSLLTYHSLESEIFKCMEWEKLNYFSDGRKSRWSRVAQSRKSFATPTSMWFQDRYIYIDTLMKEKMRNAEDLLEDLEESSSEAIVAEERLFNWWSTSVHDNQWEETREAGDQLENEATIHYRHNICKLLVRMIVNIHNSLHWRIIFYNWTYQSCNLYAWVNKEH